MGPTHQPSLESPSLSVFSISGRQLPARPDDGGAVDPSWPATEASSTAPRAEAWSAALPRSHELTSFSDLAPPCRLPHAAARPRLHPASSRASMVRHGRRSLLPGQPALAPTPPPLGPTPPARSGHLAAGARPARPRAHLAAPGGGSAARPLARPATARQLDGGMVVARQRRGSPVVLPCSTSSHAVLHVAGEQMHAAGMDHYHTQNRR